MINIRTRWIDIRPRIPRCPLQYEVPYIPVNNIAYVIALEIENLDWQVKMLPWTLASLINNTDLIMKGVHLYVVCEDGDPEDRIKNALKNFDLPEGSIIDSGPVAVALVEGRHHNRTYNAVRVMNINYWAFRDESNAHKLIFSESNDIKPYPSISEGFPPNPALYDMTYCTIKQFRHAIKKLLGSHIATRL